MILWQELFVLLSIGEGGLERYEIVKQEAANSESPVSVAR